MYNPSSLRSLEQERHQMRLAAPVLSGYLLRKEARDRGTSSRQTVGNSPMVCRDLVVQNALYTGNVEAVKELFSKGFPSDLLIQPQGGGMRYASGKVRGKNKLLCNRAQLCASCCQAQLCICLLELRVFRLPPTDLFRLSRLLKLITSQIGRTASGFWTALKVMQGVLKIAPF